MRWEDLDSFRDAGLSQALQNMVNIKGIDIYRNEGDLKIALAAVGVSQTNVQRITVLSKILGFHALLHLNHGIAVAEVDRFIRHAVEVGRIIRNKTKSSEYDNDLVMRCVIAMVDSLGLSGERKEDGFRIEYFEQFFKDIVSIEEQGVNIQIADQHYHTKLLNHLGYAYQFYLAPGERGLMSEEQDRVLKLLNQKIYNKKFMVLNIVLCILLSLSMILPISTNIYASHYITAGICIVLNIVFLILSIYIHKRRPLIELHDLPIRMLIVWGVHTFLRLFW